MDENVKIEAIAVDDTLLALLTECGINPAGIATAEALHFYGYHANGRLVGAVALEIYGRVALLRSLAVSPMVRGSGLGRALVRFAERQAATVKLEELFLLTITATPFFARLGYEEIARDRVPASIKATPQYAALCPADAVIMRKQLDHQDTTML